MVPKVKCVAALVALVIGTACAVPAQIVDNKPTEKAGLVELKTEAQLRGSCSSPSSFAGMCVPQDANNPGRGIVCPLGTYLDLDLCSYDSSPCLSCPINTSDSRYGDDIEAKTCEGADNCRACGTGYRSSGGAAQCELDVSASPLPVKPSPSNSPTPTPSVSAAPRISVIGSTSNCYTPFITYASVNLPSNGGTLNNVNTIKTAVNARNFPTGYCTLYLPSMYLHSNSRLCSKGATANVGQKFSVIFSEPSGGVSWTFKIRMDASYGYVVYFDNTQIGIETTDVWGKKSVRSYVISSVSAGQHLLEVYGGQGVSHGGESGKWTFTRGTGSTWYPLTLGNLEAVCKQAPRILYFSTRLDSNTGVDATKATIESAFLNPVTTGRTGYCSRTDLTSMALHSNQRLCSSGTATAIGQRFQINFEESGGNAIWHFSISIDAGYGYSVYLDDAKIGSYTKDVWTDGTNPFTYMLRNVALGPHKLVVYGGEGCCDGEAGAWKVQRNGQGFLDLTTANLDILSAQTDPSPYYDINSLQVGISYFSTFLKRNRGTVDANKEVIESRVSSNINGGTGYCTVSLTDMSKHSNKVLCYNTGLQTNIGQRFLITFIEPAGGVPWTFTINIDSGYGYAVYLDSGALLGKKQMDVWSGGTNPGVWTTPALSAGVHMLEVYGAEGCCDGEAGAWSFTRSGVTTPLTVTALTNVAKTPRLIYYSTKLPANLGNAGNMFYIENKYQNRQEYTASSGAYCTWSGTSFSSHANQGMCSGGSNSNIGQRFEIYFYENRGAVNWDFTVFIDAGYGFSVYFDGNFLTEKTGDVWDNGSNPTVVTASSVSIGFHRLVVYGGEGCCDGKAGDWTFQRSSGGYRALSVTNLASVLP